MQSRKPLQQTARPNQYFDIGSRGRKTGWAPEGTIQKGADGFEDYEEYFRDSSVSNMYPKERHIRNDSLQRQRQTPRNNIVSRPLVSRTPPDYNTARHISPQEYYEQSFRQVDYVDREEIIVEQPGYRVYDQQHVIKYPYESYEVVDHRFEEPVIVRNGIEYVTSPRVMTPARLRNHEIEYRSAGGPSYVVRQPQTEPRVRYSTDGFPPHYPASTSKLSRNSISRPIHNTIEESHYFSDHSQTFPPPSRRKSSSLVKHSKEKQREPVSDKKMNSKVDQSSKIVEAAGDESVEVSDEEDAQPIRKRLGMVPRIAPPKVIEKPKKRKSSIVPKTPVDLKEPIETTLNLASSKSDTISSEEDSVPGIKKRGRKPKQSIAPIEPVEDTPKVSSIIEPIVQNDFEEVEVKNEEEFQHPVDNLDYGGPVFDEAPEINDVPFDQENQQVPTIDNENIDEMPPPTEKPKKKRIRKEGVSVKKVKKETFDFKDYLKTQDQNDEDVSRRSKRTKIAPLAFWKNEKVVYGRRESGINPVTTCIQEVIRVPSDSESVYSKPKVKSKVRIKKEKLPDLPEEITVINYKSKNEEQQKICVNPEMLQATRTVGAGEYSFQKVFSEGEFFASGVLELPKGAKKPVKNSHSSAMIFVILSGYVEVQVHKTTFKIGEGGQFFVPRGMCNIYIGNQYRISNISPKTSLLFFCHGKEVAKS